MGKADRRARALPALLLLLLLGAAQAPGRAQTLTVLHALGADPGDPTYPQRIGAIVEGKDGALYAATEQGGAYGKGAFFKITTDGKLTVLHSFTGPKDGYSPVGGVTLGSDGSFYGTCYAGGALGVGTIWKCTPAGAFTLLHTLTPDDGSFPTSAPVQGRDGNFYGATSYTDNFLLGVVYRMSPTGGYVPLYKFSGKEAAAVGVFASGLIAGADGNFYGTCYRGGAANQGTVYKVAPAGSVTAIHAFDGAHGALPANIMQAPDGNLYGTCYAGGASNYGVVYKLTTAGQYTVLHQFVGTDGAVSFSGVVLAKDGFLYGITKVGGKGGRGALYRVKPDGTDFAAVYSLNGNMTEGMYAVQTPVQHDNGLLYGTTYQGGVKGSGVFYSLDMKTFSLSPVSGKVGSAVTLSGFGFTGATGVSFNGVAAGVFKVVSDTDITVTVPAGAATGTVTITTPAGTLTSKTPFQVTL